MTKPTHTTGPWKFNGDGLILAEASKSGALAIIRPTHDPREMRANARLIAMAPDMLTFIEESSCEYFGDTYDESTHLVTCERCRILNALETTQRTRR